MTRDIHAGWVAEGGCVGVSIVKPGGRAAVNVEVPAVDGDSKPFEPAALGAAVRAAAGRARGAVSVALPLSDTLVRVVELPTRDPAEIASMARLQADKISPFPVEKTVVSHEVLGESENGALVLIGLVREEVADAAGALARGAGFDPRRVDISAMGRWQTLADASAIEESGRHVLLVEESGGWELVVYQHGAPLLMRPLDVEPEPGGGPEALASTLSGSVAFALMAVEMDHGAGSVSSVVVWRASDSDPVLAAALGRLLGARGQSRSLRELAPRSEGVARRGMPRATPVLDLTPESWRKVRRVLEFRTRAIGILAAVLILWALLVAALFGGVGVEEGRLRALETERDMLKPKAMDVRTLRRRVIQLGTYGKGALSALDCMREIASIQPQGLDLNSFTYRKGDALKIGGECEDVNLIYDFRRSIDASSTLAGATLNGPAWDRQRRKNTFEVELKLPEASE